MISPQLARRFVQAANRVNELEPWLAISKDEPFAVELPGEPHPVYVTLIASDERAGVLFFHGQLGIEQLRSDQSPQPITVIARTMLLTFESLECIQAEWLAVHEAAGSVDPIVPILTACRDTDEPLAANSHELQIASQVLEAMLLAAERDLLRPKKVKLGDHQLLTIKVTGDDHTVDDIAGRFVDVQLMTTEDSVPDDTYGVDDMDDFHITNSPRSVEDLAELLVDLPRQKAHWLIGLHIDPVTRSQEEGPNVIIVADIETDAIRQINVVGWGDAPFADRVTESLIGALEKPEAGEPCVATRLTFVGGGVAAAVLGALTKAGVECDRVEQDPLMSKARDQLTSLAEHVAQERGIGSPDDNHLEADTVENSLLARLHEELLKVDAFSRKPLTMFFGAPDIFDCVDDGSDNVIHDIYCEWFAMYYRPRKGRRTIAERLLQDGLIDDERELLQARIDARAGIYELVQRDGKQMTLRDALSDFEVVIHDDTLPHSVPDGAMLTGRLVTMRDTITLLPVGPILPQTDADSALNWLKQQIGQPLTSDGLQAHPEWLGRLWQWQFETVTQRMQQPQLVNGDGDPLRIMVATFDVSSWASVEQTLRNNPDVERADDDSGMTTWQLMSRSAKPSLVGNDTVLATFECVANELLVHINSTARLTTARVLLEDIPGVKFVRVLDRTPQLTQPSFGADMQEPELAPQMPPEALARIQTRVDEQCMRWLDERQPTLDGQTPREAVASGAAGRAKVLRLIQAWPNPMGLDVTAPRSRMRAELGL